MVSQWRYFILPLLCFILWGGAAHAASVTAVADRDRIAVGESIELQLRVAGSPDGEPDFSPLEANWEILSRSQSSQMQIINGSFSRSVVYSMALMPRTQGTLMIPAVCFGQDCSLPLPIKVSKTQAKSGGTDDALLLETEISPQQIVSQGQLLFKVRLLRRVDLLDGQLNEPQPTGVSAVVKKLGDDRSYETRRNGQLYQVIERNYAIFPQGVGLMKIPALQFDGSITAGRTRFDPFGQQGQRVRRTSQPLKVEVLPLPSDVGRRPWIPASGLVLDDDWQQNPPKLTVGEPATRTLNLRVSGVQAAQLPELKPKMPAEFKTYPDQAKRDDQFSINGVTGALEQKIAIVPTHAGHFSLPAIDLDWWDINQGRWQRVHLDPLELEVSPVPGAALIGPVPSSTPPVQKSIGTKPAAEGPSQTTVGAVTPVPAKTAVGFWPWLSLALGLGWLLTLFLLFSKRQRSELSNQDSALGNGHLNEKLAYRAVLMAARNNDPQATRQALVTWCRLLLPRDQNSAYEQFCGAVGPAFLKELGTLDLCLYGEAGQPWDGQGFVKNLEAWQPIPVNLQSTGLPDLYPTDLQKGL